MIKVALVSGGRESTAMVKMMEDKYGEDFFDIKLFSNTGRDPEGLATVEYLNKTQNWDVGIVQSKHGDIQDYYANIEVEDKIDTKLNGHAMPFRAQKDCSYKFKIAPNRNALRATYGKKETFEIYYGFSFSKKEIKRKMRVLKPANQVQYCTYKFPLIDEFKIDRDMCGKVCEDFLGFIPKRSVCDMCFEQVQADWKELARTNKKRFLEICEFEESSHIYHVFGYGLNAIPLRQLAGLSAETDKNQAKLFSEDEVKQASDMEMLTKSNDPIGCACMQDNSIFMPDPDEDVTNYKWQRIPDKIKHLVAAT